MKQELRELINKYTLQKISKEEFVKSFPQNILKDKSLTKELVKNGLEKNNNDDIEVGYMLMLIQNDILGCDFDIELLCDLLQSKAHYHHEDIAMLLTQLKSSSTVDCIYNVAELKFEYLDYDDTYQFARKCIKALSAIGDENAINKLKLHSDSTTSEIAEYPKKELRYKELL